MSNDENNAQDVQTNTNTDNNAAEGQVQDNNAADDSGAGDSGGDEGDNTPPADEGTEKKEKRPGWVQKRFNELTFEKKQAREEADRYKKQTEELMAELAAARSVSGDGEDGNKLPLTEIERLANERAKDLAAKQLAESRYAESLDRIWNSGVKEFADFGDTVDNLNGAFGEKFSAVLPVFTEALDNPHKVMHHLGENLDEAARILSLSPAKQVAELTKLEASLTTKAKPISKVAAPIKTIDAKGKADPTLDNDKLSIDEWMKLRDKDLEKKGRRKF